MCRDVEEVARGRLRRAELRGGEHEAEAPGGVGREGVRVLKVRVGAGVGVERKGRAGLRVCEERDARARDGRSGAAPLVDDAEGVDDRRRRRARNGGRVVGPECGDVD